jgi:hypothetical protein
MVLQAADFPKGATVVSQRGAAVPSLPRLAHSSAYTRTFEAVSADGAKISSLVSSALLLAHASDARRFMSSIAAAAGSALGRAGLVEVFQRELAASLSPRKLVIVSSGLERARVLGVADETVEYVFAVRTPAAKIEVGEIYVWNGRGLELVSYVAGALGVPAGEDISLARKAAAHIEDASSATQPTAAAPANVVPPSISGTVQPGAVITAQSGSWTGAAASASYTYQWYVCSNAGAACVPIAGATAPSYTVSLADAGSELVVSVALTTSAGQARSSSQPTAVVP